MADPSATRVGVVYLVGAGPGDPGLITLRGARCLGVADVVIHDTLANVELLQLAPASAERISAGKRDGRHCVPQEVINDLMIACARAGQTVVRLKGGDPFVFGRGGEEAAALRAAGVPYEIVPGVTAGVAVPAYAGIPVTHRDHASAVAFVTGHEDLASETSKLNWRALAEFPGTLVCYMGVRRLAGLVDTLLRHGRAPSTPVAVIQQGTTSAQRTVTGAMGEIVARADAAGIRSPAVIIVGEVVEMAETLRWFESRPLFGQRVVVTRPRDQASAMSDRLAELGAEVLLLPAMRVEPPESWASVDRAIAELATYDWLAFTSANGVCYFLRRLGELGFDLRKLAGLRLAAIGEATARELAQHHLQADLVPAEANSEALVGALREVARPSRILLLRAEEARDALPAGLAAAGICYDDVAVYRTVAERDWNAAVIDRIANAEIDWITVTSPRVVQILWEHLPAAARHQLGRQVKLASISPLTSSAVRQVGLAVAVEAAMASAEALIDAMVRWVRARSASES